MRPYYFLILLLVCPISCRRSTVRVEESDPPQGNLVIYHSMVGVETHFGADSCWMLFDTGALGKCVVDDAVIIRGLGVESVTEDNYQWPDTIKIAGVPTGHTQVGSTLKFSFLAKTEHPDKILGMDFFKGMIGPDFNADKRVWEINFERRQMTIHEKDTIPPYRYVDPITMRAHPYVNIPMQLVFGRDTVVTNVECALDLGAAAFMVYDRIAPDLLARLNRLPHMDARFLDSQPVIRDYKVDRVLFLDGFAAIDNPSFVVLDTISSLRGPEQRLGIEFWQRFNIMIDCGRELLYLEPYPYDPFLLSSSASNYRRSRSNMGLYVYETGAVSGLFERMAVQRAGLKAGDCIMTLNNYDFQKLSLDKRDSIFHYMPVGYDVRLSVIRNNEPHVIEFTTDANPLR